MEKLTYEFVKSKFEEEGYELLSTEYVNSKTKLRYRCPNGHEHSINYCNWFKGARCPYCTGNAKLTIEFVRESFEKEGYMLLSNKYNGSKIKLKYRCPKGHKHSIKWNVWQRGHRCPYCAGQGRPRFDGVKFKIEKEGYKLLSNNYVNSRTKLDLICNKGHSTSMTFYSWQEGARCKYCARNVRFKIEFIREQFEKEGYTLLSTEYINQKQKLDYICPLGHKHSITFTDWHNGGYRCPTCYAIKISGPGNCGWQGGISKEGYCHIWSDREYKQDIKDRDSNRCLNPTCYSNNPYDLTVHHIDYVKTNCGPENLITVCRACNNRANQNREWHKAWYQAIMHRRYNYIY